jgi:hypothetical protein
VIADLICLSKLHESRLFRPCRGDVWICRSRIPHTPALAANGRFYFIGAPVENLEWRAQNLVFYVVLVWLLQRRYYIHYTALHYTIRKPSRRSTMKIEIILEIR